jgi:hypothetical protein
LHEAIHVHAPLPQLVNHSGDSVLFSTAHYAVRDPAAATRGLDQWLGEWDEGRYELLEGTTVHAHFELEPEQLQVECNSKERLAKAKVNAVWIAVDAARAACEIGARANDPCSVAAEGS